MQDRIRDLEKSPDPIAHVRSHFPLWGFGAAILYTLIFAGAGLGVVGELAAGRRTFSDTVGILATLILLVVGGCLLLVWFGYMYRLAFRLRNQRGKQDR